MRDIENKLTHVTNSTYDQLNNAAVKIEVEPAQVIVKMSRLKFHPPLFSHQNHSLIIFPDAFVLIFHLRPFKLLLCYVTCINMF